MRKLVLSLVLAAAVLAGCTAHAPRQSAPVRKQANGSYWNDPAVMERDSLMKQGDIGVEKFIPDYTPQNGGSPVEAKGSGIRMNSAQRELHPVSPDTSIEPMDGDYANNMITFARSFLGTPYEFGSDRDEPSTFDCSDFTRYAFLGALGMDLPKDSRSQARYIETFGNRSYTDLSEAKRGDLLFFMDYKGWKPENYRGINPANERISHVGIYLGNGNMLHTASQASGGVRIDYILGKPLEWRFVKGGSVLQESNETDPGIGTEQQREE
ncbi:NlpC/P60 family protein [Paenibacillus tarimensis]